MEKMFLFTMQLFIFQQDIMLILSIYQEKEQQITLYEPNQFVMSSGVLDFSGGPLRIRSKLSRNLNSGDRIALALATPATTGGTILQK